MSAQLARLLPKLSPSSPKPGHNIIWAAKNGAMTNSMKPICELGRFNLSLSLRNCTGIPRAFSWSPCAKNSSRQTMAQAYVVSHDLQGFDTSAECRMHSMTSILVSALRNISNSAMLAPLTNGKLSLLLKTSWFIWYVIWRSLTMAPCPIMSVCRMASMQVLRASLYSSLLNLLRTFSCGTATNVYNFAQCMFSSGERSLYCKANSWPTSDKKPLFTPGWPKSCDNAEISSMYWSNSERKASTFINDMSRPTPCRTSTACAKLWKGTGR
mmetsp:Transcript_42323/g.119686  ORF Transcript_42323/g.119686 Transcript_42323/m.119686 type:complete len:269 (-) Transcript_42323:79-885(-)